MRSPAMPAPTTTARRVTTVSSAPESALDRDRLRRADVRSLLDRRAQRLLRLVVEHDELALLVELEHLRRGEDALAVVLADVTVHDHLEGHRRSSSTRKGYSS